MTYSDKNWYVQDMRKNEMGAFFAQYSYSIEQWKETKGSAPLNGNILKRFIEMNMLDIMKKFGHDGLRSIGELFVKAPDRCKLLTLVGLIQSNLPSGEKIPFKSAEDNLIRRAQDRLLELITWHMLWNCV